MASPTELHDLVLNDCQWVKDNHIDRIKGMLHLAMVVAEFLAKYENKMHLDLRGTNDFK